MSPVVPRAALSLAVLLCCTVAWSAPVSLAIKTEHSFPAVMVENGEIIGYATEKVRELLRRSSIDYTIELQPWKRAYTLALTQPATCVYPTTRTPERQTLFKWVGPLVETDWVLYGRAGRNKGITRLDQVRGMRIGSYLGDVRGEYLKDLGFQVEFVTNDEANPQKLMLDRIDLWVTSPRFAQLRLTRSGLAGSVVPVLTFNRALLYLACNPAVADADIARMSAALAAMHVDGTVKALDQKYEQWETRNKDPAVAK
jgi:polar amino acid transport system substrate-binding protein